MRLLVVEDNARLAEIIYQGLKATGFDSDLARCIGDAQDAARLSDYAAHDRGRKACRTATEEHGCQICASAAIPRPC